MKAKSFSIFWGLLLVLGGGLLLVRELGYKWELSSQFWIAAFAGAGAFFLVIYFLHGVQHWGWLFPASIFAALALTIALSEAGVHGSVTGAPIVASVALPFVVAFLLDTAKRGWALIPAWVMASLTLIVLLTDSVGDDVVGALVIWSVALPFLLAFLLNRRRSWALIVAVVLGISGLFPLMDSLAGEEAIGSLVMFVIALPFFVVYFWSKPNWWALIPAGFFTSIGLIVALSMVMGMPKQSEPWLRGILLLGWGITFGVLWLRRATQPTGWTKYPAVGLLVSALLAVGLGVGAQNLWPVLIIALGVWLLLGSLRRKPDLPQAKPQA